jgi:LysR family transcriptional regulator, hydrogen peroxide-inducible genes activator
MVAGGIGITLLPAMARRADDRGLRYLPFSDAPTREIGLVFRRSSTRRATMSALAQTLRRLAPDGST